VVLDGGETLMLAALDKVLLPLVHVYEVFPVAVSVAVVPMQTELLPATEMAEGLTVVV
jgi:hypothetical protein